MAQILVVDDEESLLKLLGVVLRGEGYTVHTSAREDEALDVFRREPIDLVLLDLKMGKIGGIELLRRFKDMAPQVPVIIITAHSTWQNAVEAMRLGAYDYIKKPFDNDSIRRAVKLALDRKAEFDRYRDRKTGAAGISEILGNEQSIRDLLERVSLVAPTDSTMLVVGESGTGKELFARALHACSLRAAGPFISVNCAAFPEALLESELFGHVRGAFSGAHQDKQGLLELADKGTFFLDEVGEMPRETQVKLLRVLEERQFYPVGGTKPRRIDVRFITATNKDLGAEVAAGSFREDLYYRLNVIPIRIPPLRERKGDIPLLAAHFLARYSRRLGREITGITESAQAALVAFDWPGNVRELENVIQRAVALTRGEKIEWVELPASGGRPGLPSATATGSLLDFPPDGLELERRMEDIERRFILLALERTGGNVTQAARTLGITFRSMRYKIRKLGLLAQVRGEKIDEPEAEPEVEANGGEARPDGAGGAKDEAEE